MKKVLTIVGARPQFIKAAVVSRELANAGVQEVLVHTGQHYDAAMSDVFFADLSIPAPAYQLGIAGGSHGAMTGRMLQSMEPVIQQVHPDAVLVYGDTNSTLVGGLAAAKLAIPVLHVEAGLRSFDPTMPEEINRRLVDHLSMALFCPTDSSVANLRAEGIVRGVYQVGDVMLDAVRQFAPVAAARDTVLRRLGLLPRGYVLATCHRSGNVDERESLEAILGAFQDIAAQESLVLPLHPRTREAVSRHGLQHLLNRITVIEPVGFLDMLNLERSARLILTDSGGVQKEAFFFQVPCITIRNETEWTETVACGWNRLAGITRSGIVAAWREPWQMSAAQTDNCGDAWASRRIAQTIVAL